MLKRIITAAVGMVILIPFLIFSHTWALVVMTGLMSSIAVFELLKCTGRVKKILPTVMCMAVVLALQVCAKALAEDIYTSVAMLIFMAFAIIFLTMAVFSKGGFTVSEAARDVVMTFYVGFGFSSLILLRNIENDGLILFLLAFFIPWVCDAMAYFVGVTMGKHKLIPSVSPKKTVEGAVGGIVGVVALTAIFCIVVKYGFEKELSLPLLLVLAFVGGLVGQCGDLIASLLKRECGIKDYGNLFPGHGGVMDRFDSIIAVATFMYIVCRIFYGVAVI